MSRYVTSSYYKCTPEVFRTHYSGAIMSAMVSQIIGMGIQSAEGWVLRCWKSQKMQTYFFLNFLTNSVWKGFSASRFLVGWRVWLDVLYRYAHTMLLYKLRDIGPHLRILSRSAAVNCWVNQAAGGYPWYSDRMMGKRSVCRALSSL